MSEEIQLVIRQASGEDSAQLLALSQQVAKETDYLIMDEYGMGLSEELLAEQLDLLAQADNQLLLLAFDGTQCIGAASIKGNDEYRIHHIGEVGIFIAKEYWSLGIGSLLMEELIEYVKQVQIFKRLELTVQTRNQKAIALYQKFGFRKEATLKYGARLDNGEFVDVDLMARFFEVGE
ncbi:GNAT family N-acetyltransferase [Enterococcus cecorum]|uniref:GNAT family N-acetyltransferase n=1 Tax=Enterococcus cecorum TaxID=44008 RepID=UPI001FABD43A|nr:GNAT family N-acetyltransferase [Enterococcus cecorum]MCJ0538027.1 GNAT family N-acetyltransferase [Enterococcus cecorum]MCJ0545899.1 GNAT family N-acetyltransferase [Enterococcus cecorum]MCJ0549649.1 GNAT family N-acetyltransferase [Enterococcus cecorum]MCJ0568673.1 GNAT family N-acetyltransferase [Enterococcus cecorum]